MSTRRSGAAGGEYPGGNAPGGVVGTLMACGAFNSGNILNGAQRSPGEQVLGERTRGAINRATAVAARFQTVQNAIRSWAAGRVPSVSCRVLFICKGNICRSAYAEWAARSRLGTESGWEFMSAGLEATTGTRPPEGAVRVALERTVDLRAHQARPISAIAPDNPDVVFVMEPLQLCDRRLALFRRRCPVIPLGAVIGVPVIADPFGASDAVFRTCFTEIDAAIDVLSMRPRRSE